MNDVQLGLRLAGRRGAMWRPLADVPLQDLASALPWREQVRHRGEVLDLGRFASATTGAPVMTSDGIWDRLELADFDPKVRAIVGQPFQIRAEHSPGKAGHVPDLMLIDTGGAVTIVNSAPTAGELSPSPQVLDWAESVFRSIGWSYEWWTGPQDTQQFTNIKALSGFNRPMHHSQQALIEPILELCADSKLSIGEVEEHFAPQTPHLLVRPVIQHLLWWGDLSADLRKPIGLRTPVRTDSAARRPAPGHWEAGTRLDIGFDRGTILRCTGDEVVVALDPSPRGYGVQERRTSREKLAREATALPAAYQRPLFPAQPLTAPH